MAEVLKLAARIHALRVESTTELVGTPDRFANIEWLALHLHDLVTNPVSPEVLARICAYKSVIQPLMVPRDNETDIDKLQAEASDLFRQLRGIRERLNKLEAQPLDVADQLGTADERIDNIEKHCDAMDGRIEQVMSLLGMGKIKPRTDGMALALDMATPRSAELPPEDPAIIAWRASSKIEKLFEMGTDQCGIMRLERWPEGIVFWYHGIIAWRSWAK